MKYINYFIPLFVWLNIDVTNDMDVCEFYPKFAQKRSHSENIRKNTLSLLIEVFSKGFVFKIVKEIGLILALISDKTIN